MRKQINKEIKKRKKLVNKEIKDIGQKVWNIRSKHRYNVSEGPYKTEIRRICIYTGRTRGVIGGKNRVLHYLDLKESNKNL
jgi:hypothetical protein